MAVAVAGVASVPAVAEDCGRPGDCSCKQAAESSRLWNCTRIAEVRGFIIVFFFYCWRWGGVDEKFFRFLLIVEV